jgi:hypothetical protein
VRWVFFKQHIIGSCFFKSSLLFCVYWVWHGGHLHSLLILRGAWYFQLFLFPYCLLFSYSLLLVCLVHKVYSFLHPFLIQLFASMCRSVSIFWLCICEFLWFFLIMEGFNLSFN